MPNYRISLLATILSLAASTAQGQELRVGAARIDITPPTGFPMWGYGARHDSPTKRIRDQLHARAVVVEVGKSRVAIVALDLGRAPTRSSRDRIANQLKEKCGIEHFFLVASHTHHGPVLELDTWPDAKKPYVRDLEHKIVKAIEDACRTAEGARMTIVRSEENFNRNRHSKRMDRPVDRELLVVRFDSIKTEKTIAHLVNFAAHPTMLPASLHEFSPDFPGFLCAHVEKNRGGVCLFLQGAAGDLSPETAHGRTPEAFGKSLGQKALDLLKDVKAQEKPPRDLKTSRHTFNFGKRVDLDNPFIRAAYSIAFFPDLISFYEREYREGIRPDLTVALLGEKIGIVGVSGEFFSGHALSLKKRARLDHLLFLGYCNDYHQYFPTIEAASEGGYGADEIVAPVEVGAGERMMNHALLELYRMRGMLK